MERLIIFLGLCCFAILAGSTPTNPSTVLTNQDHVKDAAQIEECPVEVQQLKRIRDQEKNTEKYRSDLKEGPAADLSSHDILLDPGLISARPARLAGTYLSSVKSDDESESIDLSKRNSDPEGDLGVIKDDDLSQYPYLYEKQYENPKYRMNSKRETYIYRYPEDRIYHYPKERPPSFRSYQK